MKNVLFHCHGNQIQEKFSLLGCHGNHNFPYYCVKGYFCQCHHVFGHQKLIKWIFFVKNVIIMFLAISPNNNDLTGAKLSQNIFHFESTAIFFKIGQFTKLFHSFVVSLSYDAS